MFKTVKMPIQIKKRSIISHIFCLMILTLSIILCGCNNSSSVDEETFEEKYEAAKNKYDKYYHKIVSGQEVLDLIENWDETDFKMTVEDYEGERFRVSNIDKDNTIFKYWDKDSIYYIDPDAFYEAHFVVRKNPRKERDKHIGELYFALVEDSSLSEDNTTEDND